MRAVLRGSVPTTTTSSIGPSPPSPRSAPRARRRNGLGGDAPARGPRRPSRVRAAAAGTRTSAIATALSRPVHAREAATRTMPTNQPRNGIASAIIAANSSLPACRRAGEGRPRDDLLGRPEALEHVADGDLVGGAALRAARRRCARGSRRRARPAATRGSERRGLLEPPQVVGDELVRCDGGHRAPPLSSRPSTPSRNRAHSLVKPASASRPPSVSW